MASAARTIALAAAYFVPDGLLVEALLEVRRRGPCLLQTGAFGSALRAHFI